MIDWRSKTGLLGCSLALSLCAAELFASLIHRHAFPYLNLFQADERYGVRLMPNARTRVRSREGRITDITTNSLGFRGPDWLRSKNSILLLGDSQMFGYGVACTDAIPAQLERALETRVLNAAVPSWGPAEYALATAEFAPIFRPQYVLFVANAANDWFETVPNVERTTARDGWAARARAPELQPFPFRSWLMGKSHLVLAIRQLAKRMGDAELPPAASARLLNKDHGTHRSRLTPSLRAVVQTCESLGCRVIAIALPLDVQVHPAEWKKYRVPPEDMSASEALLSDFVDEARALGIPALNLLPILRQAEPGAFLTDDYHLSPWGHHVAADAIAQLIREHQASVAVRQ